MQKKLRNMIIAITAVVVLIAMLIVLALLPNNQNYTGEDTSLIVNSKTSEEISSVDIKNTTDEYTVNIVDGKCKIDGFDNVNISETSFNKLKANSSEIKAVQVVTEEAPNLDEYGLANPSNVAQIHYNDGSTIKLNIGNKAPMSAGTYVSVDNSDKVYLFSEDNLASFYYSKFDYVDKSIVPTKDDNGSNLTIKTVDLKGGNRPSDVEIDVNTDSNNTTTYQVKSAGIQATGDTTATPAVVVELKNLKADSVVNVNPTTEDIANYGLTQPFATATLTYSDRTVNVSISSDYDGICYVMNKEYPVVYKVQSSKQDWATATFETLASKTIIESPLSTVNNITVKTPDKSYVFNATTNAVSSTASDGSQTSSNVTAVTCNDKNIDSTNFKMFYQNMIGAKVDKFTTDNPNAQDIPLLTISIKYNDSSKQPNEYSFYSWGTDENDVLVTKNGDCNSATTLSYVTNIIDDCEKLLNGQTIETVS